MTSRSELSDQDILKEELERITREHDGVLDPEVVVEEAKPASSPIHKRFQWDNDAAGHLYRCEQARGLIASVRVDIQTKRRSIDSIAYVHDPRLGNNMGGYIAVQEVPILDSVEVVLDAEIKRTRDLARRTVELATALERMDYLPDWVTEALKEKVAVAA